MACVEVPGCGGAEEGKVVLGEDEREGTGAPCLRVEVVSWSRRCGIGG